MSELEWEKFFELIDKIVDMPDKTASEKGEIIRRKAEVWCGSLEEFVALADG
jgi:hypothetical protein